MKFWGYLVLRDQKIGVDLWWVPWLPMHPSPSLSPPLPDQYSRYCFIFLPLFDIIIKPHLRIQSLLGFNQNLRSSLAGDTNLLDVIEVLSITFSYISEVEKNLFIILKNWCCFSMNGRACCSSWIILISAINFIQGSMKRICGLIRRLGFYMKRQCANCVPLWLSFRAKPVGLHMS